MSETTARSKDLRDLWRQSRRDPAHRRVLSLALPAVAEQLLNMGVGLADAFMVGHLGASAVGAVGLSNQIVLLVTTFFAAMATGVTALIARHTGAKEAPQANFVLHQGYIMGTAVGVVASVASYLLAPAAMHLLQAPADVAPLGADYLCIVSLTFVLASWLFIGNAALRGSGDTRTPMFTMLAVNLINIAVAYATIYGIGPIPQMGVRGSAIGAAVARAMGGLIVTAVLIRGRSGLVMRIKGMVPSATEIRRILRIGLPAGGEQLLNRLGMMAFTATVAGLGTLAYAAHQIAVQAESLAYMPGFGFAVAATTLAGQGLGAKDVDRAHADVVLAQKWGTLVQSVMGLVLIAIPGQLIGLFINDPAVVSIGTWPLRLEGFSQPGLATVFILSGALRGAGDARATLVITAGTLWLIRVPLAHLLVGPFGLLGAWIAMGIDLNVRAFLMWRRFRSNRWTQIRV